MRIGCGHSTLALAVSLLAACADGGDGEQEPVPSEFELPSAQVPVDDEFLVAIIPDTQVYARDFPETFDSQMEWLAANAETYRIAFVSHVGDVVEDAEDPEQWVNARRAFDFLDEADLPHGISIGSHDWGDLSGLAYPAPFDGVCDESAQDCTTWDFRANFGPERYGDRSWYGGSSPSGNSSYQRVEIEGLPLLFMHLRMNTPRPELEWAQSVLDANPDALVHVTTHRYMYDYRIIPEFPDPLSLLSGGRLDPISHQFGQVVDREQDLRADQLFDQFVSPNTNIFMVHCGHIDAEFRQVSTNAAGLPVHEILVDFQNMLDGGGGWLRLLKFKPSENEIEVFTFSTTTGEIRENGDNLEHALFILEFGIEQEADELVSFGLDPNELVELLEFYKNEGKEQYRASLYATGARDSKFTVDVDFDAYPGSLQN